jgi:hypothetical protein
MLSTVADPSDSATDYMPLPSCSSIDNANYVEILAGRSMHASG